MLLAGTSSRCIIRLETYPVLLGVIQRGPEALLRKPRDIDDAPYRSLRKTNKIGWILHRAGYRSWKFLVEIPGKGAVGVVGGFREGAGNFKTSPTGPPNKEEVA